ncbi:MAG: hypothetical protein ABR610_06955 [Thermoanaerobaculia bacterium]
MDRTLSESLARKFFPKRDAVGRRMKVGLGDEWSSVVGVVGDVRQHRLVDSRSDGLRSVPAGSLARPDPRRAHADASREGGDRARGGGAFDRSDQALSRLRPMRQVVSESVSAQRPRMVLLALFPFLAVVLASVGLYGVMAYSWPRDQI